MTTSASILVVLSIWILGSHASAPIYDVQFRYQSQEIRFDQWIALFTLGLSPLIAHIIAGIPTIVYRDKKNPKWHDMWPLYNPTTIAWWYFAVADRRIRSKNWDRHTMAASNAVFWKGRGWDGSEDAIDSSNSFCAKDPRNLTVDIISSSSAKTLILVLQGGSSVYSLVLSLLGQDGYSESLPTIFSPLALISLLRVPAAAWLTDDFAYHDVPDDRHGGLETVPEISFQDIPKPNEIFHRRTAWRGILVRVLFILVLLGLLVLTLCFALPIGDRKSGVQYTISGLLQTILFAGLLASTSVIFACYFFSSRSATTMIPCISAPWYKVYTGVVYFLFFVLILFAALETREAPCGKYTIRPPNDDYWTCRQQDRSKMSLSMDPTLPDSPYFGLVYWDTTDTPDLFKVWEWDGWCEGTFVHEFEGSFIGLGPKNVTY